VKSIIAKNLVLGLVLLTFTALFAACGGSGDSEPDCDADSLQNCIATRTPTPKPTPPPTQTPTPTATPANTQTPTPAPTPPPAACSGQGLIGIDPNNNVGYVPIYALDSKGNAQLAVVDLTVGKASPVLKELSLTGTQQPMAVAFNPNNKTMLAESRNSTTGDITLYEIDTTAQSIKNMVAATGLTQNGTGGGIVENATTNKAFVAGNSTLGILDTSKSPPVWDAASVITTPFMDSFSVNSVTNIMFIASDSSNSIVDTSKSPLAPLSFTGFAVDDGNGFDIATNIALVSQEVGADTTVAMNFATLNTTVSPATADNVLVPSVCPGGGTSCVSGLAPFGEGPGGQAVIDCSTHQATVADEFGQNIKLVQLPTKPVAGALDNNGRPGSGTPPDAASVWTIAATIIPKGTVGTTATQLGIVGDPNSLSVDPEHNFAYMLADTNTNFHEWSIGSTSPLFLVRVDLSKPVPGASPNGGVDGKTMWTPASAAIPLPMK
jgi:hypothetical protein